MVCTAGSRSCGRTARRRGFMIAEVICSLLIVGICLTILVRLSYWHLQDSRRLARRALALEHATNLLEELRGRPWTELVGGIDRTEPLPQELAGALPGGQARIRVTGGVEGSPRCRRLVVNVRWNEYGDAPAGLELVAWRCPRSVETAPEN
jgi:hypothetical protein